MSSDRINKIAYLECLRRVKLPDGAVRVLVALFTYSDASGGNIRPGIKRLAGDCCMGQSTVRRHLDLLVERGFIRQVYRGGRTGGGHAYASGYQLCQPNSTAQNRAVDDDSTAQNRAVDNDSQPLTSESQPLTSEFSTAQFTPLNRSVVSTHQVKEQVNEPGKNQQGESGHETADLAPDNEVDAPAPYLRLGFVPSQTEPTLANITPPSRFCRKHQPAGTDTSCHACGNARVYRDSEWPYTATGVEYSKCKAAADQYIRRSGGSGAKQLEMDMLRAQLGGNRIGRTPTDIFNEIEDRRAARGLSGPDRNSLAWMSLGRQQPVEAIEAEVVSDDGQDDNRTRRERMRAAFRGEP
ncbi:helix-turn-helix domain-containing protein [Mycobacterium asiaticum]|uniref:helix-turn-helix domain-containing protein n=1 Tax=Mycobacterium asiaticum TaxID=1790 RepID=UPI000AA4B924|nr:helix-turn-helix domain-containing protein [Mycobacterium asiaticum]